MQAVHQVILNRESISLCLAISCDVVQSSGTRTAYPPPFSQRSVVAHILARFFGPLNVEVVVEELQSVNTSVDRNIIIMIFRR